MTENRMGKQIIDITVRTRQELARGLLDEEVFRAARWSNTRSSSMNHKTPRSVIEVKRVVDSLAFFASWRDNISSLPVDSADEPKIHASVSHGSHQRPG